MPSTISLQNTINWAQTFCRLQPLTGVGGVDTEPAMTIANTVLQMILAPPFAWSWNRGSVNITTAASTQDYVTACSTFGWLEKAVVSSSAGMYEAEVKVVLPDATEQGRPLHVSPQIDDGAGNITFRLFPVPDGIYTVKLIFQRCAPVFAALTTYWAPVPDKLLYLYSAGFLSYALEQIDDQRFPTQMSLFLKQLAAANVGLSETQKALILDQRLTPILQPQSEIASRQGR